MTHWYEYIFLILLDKQHSRIFSSVKVLTYKTCLRQRWARNILILVLLLKNAKIKTVRQHIYDIKMLKLDIDSRFSYAVFIHYYWQKEWSTKINFLSNFYDILIIATCNSVSY